jgi:hypothetical protein
LSSDLSVLYQDAARNFVSGNLFSQVRALSAGDIDGDGLVDLVCTFGILLQTAPRVFGSSLTVSGFSLLGAADFDGNGRQDLVASNAEGLRILLQTAPRIFAGGDPIPLDRSDSLLTADLDNDGDVDIASSAFSGGVSVCLRSAGGFVLVPVDMDAEEPTRLIAADLNSDGALDLAQGDICDGLLLVSYQTEPGVFAPAVVVAGPELLGIGTDPAAGDIDGDGDLDIVTRNGTVLLQGEQGLSTDSFVSLGGQVGLVADLDLDGNLDTQRGPLVAYQASPGAAFERELVPVPMFGEPDPDPLPERVLVADLNHDGISDLLVQNAQTLRGEMRLTVFFQTIAGALDRSPLTLPRLSTRTFLAAGDIDLDGDSDFAQGADLVFQTAPGVFGARTPIGAPLLAFGDVDGDGDLDLVTADASLGLRFQVSPGAFSGPLALAGGSQPTTAVVADVDADGRADVGGGYVGSDEVIVFFQEASGGFQSRAIPALVDPGSLVAADMDGDGDLDLACTSVAGLAVITQTGARVFGAPTFLGTAGSSLSVADLERDGDLDLVTEKARVFQASPGRFESAPTTFSTSFFRGFQVATDFDADGDPDVLSAFDDENVALFFGGR